MPTSYKFDLLPPEAVPAYKAAHPPGSSIILPDLKNPGKSIGYTVQEIQVAEVDPHPDTGETFQRVTLVLKN